MSNEISELSSPDQLDLYEARDTTRLEAFSDGVFAVAITLLVLEIKIPRSHDVKLLSDLLHQWPEYIAYFFSFIMIGIYWMNHHHIFKYIRNADQVLMFLNVLLLSWVVLIPFGTGILAEYIGRERSLEQYATIVFSGIGLCAAVSFNIVWRYAVWKRNLLDPGLEKKVIDALTRDYNLGVLMYVGALALVPLSVPVSLLLTLGLSLFFASPARNRKPARKSLVTSK